MGEGAVLPEQAPPDRAEVVLESERTRVTRLFVSRRTVIRKEPLGPDAQRRLRYELTVLERLRGVVGVAQVLDEPRYPGSIMLADAGDASLAVVVKPLAVDQLIGLAAALAAAVAGMHGRGVMHRDICPSNVAITSDCTPCLVGFASATLLAELRPEFTHHTKIVGTLPYLAPEQTGRTGRPVDHRADLYALGATLYELATGEPPFGSQDPLRLMHDVVARVPTPPCEVNPAGARTTVGDHHASPGKGARRPLPVGGRAESTTLRGWPNTVRRQGLQRGSVSATFRCACWRRRGSSAATTSWSR